MQIRNGRLGVSTAVIAVVAVLVIAAAAATGYFLLTQPASVTTQTQGSGPTSQVNSLTTAATGTTTAATSQATSAASTGTSPGSIFLPNDTSALFNQFNAMTIQFTSAQGSNQTTETISFAKNGTATILGVPATRVDFNFQSSSGESSPAVLYYAQNGTVISIGIGGFLVNGTMAQEESVGLTALFNVFVGYNRYFNNPAYYAALTPSGTSTQTFGSVTMDVSTYKASSVNYAGSPVSDVTVSFGKLPNSNLSMMVYLQGTTTTPEGTSTGTFQLVSATLA